MTHQEIERLAEDALNAACKCIQDRLGQTDGGLAGMWFSDEDAHRWFGDYIRAELAEKKE